MVIYSCAQQNYSTDLRLRSPVIMVLAPPILRRKWFKSVSLEADIRIRGEQVANSFIGVYDPPRPIEKVFHDIIGLPTLKTV